jgi:hypothetical protein
MPHPSAIRPARGRAHEVNIPRVPGGESPLTYECLAWQRSAGRIVKAHIVCFMERQRKEKGCFVILLFLDEKKQKSSDCT